MARIHRGGHRARPWHRPGRTALLGALWLATGQGWGADVYRSTGPGGETVYSDTPSPGAQRVEVPPASVYEAPPVKARAPADQDASPAGFSGLRIASPADDSVHWKADGPLRVALEADPPLAADHVAVLHVDGAALVRAAGGAPLVLPLETLAPGTHVLAVEVQDAQGRPLGRTEAVQVHIRQHNLNLPARPPRPGSGTGGAS